MPCSRTLDILSPINKCPGLLITIYGSESGHDLQATLSLFGTEDHVLPAEINCSHRYHSGPPLFPTWCKSPSLHLAQILLLCVLSHVRLCDSLDCSLPGSSVSGIFRWVVIFCSKKSSRSRNWAPVSCIFCTGRRICCRCCCSSLIWNLFLCTLLSSKCYLGPLNMKPLAY